MQKTKRLVKRHIGLPVMFAAFDNKTYYGRLIGLRNRVASVAYQLTNDHGCVVRECTTYLPTEQQSRITLA